MDYFDTLRRNSWLADPGERVRVVAIHAVAASAIGEGLVLAIHV